jgi:parallel beta-helix repeat protein/predicted outer membrane repeat protein
MSRTFLMPAAVIVAILILALSLSAQARIIYIYGDFMSIQYGINNSSDGDTVLVYPGTYQENINVYEHNIVIGSLFITSFDSLYIQRTIIEGKTTIRCGEIKGFTLRNAMDFIIYFNCGLGIIRNNIIDGSNSWSSIYCYLAFPIICNNMITNCGTGIYCDWTGGIISDNSFVNNGTGIYLGWENRCTIKNNLFYGNHGNRGAAIYCDGYSTYERITEIINNTIAGNSADSQGGGIYCSVARTNHFKNNIIWNNSAPEGANIYVCSPSWAPTITYCNIQDTLWPGEGNISADPLFVDPANGDFHLQRGSPCIDTGDPNSPLDPDSTRADMGAFYFDQTTGIDELINLLPKNFALSPNYPNPFNAATVISYSLPQQCEVVLDIYDLLGRRVESLHDGIQQPGEHSLIWHADGFSSGVYFYKLTAGDFSETRKMMLVR